MNGRVVFDLDGTLIDSAPDIQGIANAALEKIGVTPITLAETRSFIGNGIDVFVARMRKARAIPDSEQARLLGLVADGYEDAVHLTVLYPGVTDALRQLSRHYRLGICTNKPYRPAVSVLGHMGIDSFFTTVRGGDSPLGRKPDPSPLEAAFADLGDGPRLFVGDSEVDAETASRAGVPFLLFTEGYRKSPVAALDHAAPFGDFLDLCELVNTILRGQS